MYQPIIYFITAICVLVSGSCAPLSEVGHNACNSDKDCLDNYICSKDNVCVFIDDDTDTDSITGIGGDIGTDDADIDALGNVYYVSNQGDDSNSGSSADAPWATLSKINDFDFSPGDVIRFERNGLWRGQLVPQSGSGTADIQYTSYGSGTKPILMGSLSKRSTNDWADQGDHIWAAAEIVAEIGNIIFDHTAVGTKCADETDLDAQNEFWYDDAESRVLLFSSEHPAKLYTSIELAQKRHIIDQSDKSYVSYSNLHLRYGGAHGIGGGNTRNITIRDCDLHYIGGAYLSSEVRYGNGIEFWDNATNILVEGCKISNVYDTGITNQGNGDQFVQRNIRYRENRVSNCESGFEIWAYSENSVMEEIYLEDNVFENSGFSWGSNQRSDTRGNHIIMWSSTASSQRIFFTGNTFINSSSYAIDTIPTQVWNGIDDIHVDYNSYIQTKDTKLIRWNNNDDMSGYDANSADFEAYQNETGNDLNSTLAFP